MGLLSKSQTKTIVVPILISKAIEPSMYTTIEKTIHDDLSKSEDQYIVESSDHYVSVTDPVLIKDSSKGKTYVQLVHGSISSDKLIKMIVHDLTYKKSSFTAFIDTLATKVYRMFARKKKKFINVDFSDIWHSKNSFVILAVSDVDKISMKTKGNFDTDEIIKLQKNGWGNIAIFDREVGGLKVYFKEFEGLMRVIRF